MGPGVMYESEALRLQREADNFTKKFEHEKKRLMILEDQYTQACKELKEKKEHLLKVTPTEKQMIRDNTIAKALENQLDKCLVKYNSIQAENKLMR
jgi:hypothetical protein